MSRDGSSGGVIRMAVITKDGVERLFVPGNKLPGNNFFFFSNYRLSNILTFFSFYSSLGRIKNIYNQIYKTNK